MRQARRWAAGTVLLAACTGRVGSEPSGEDATISWDDGGGGAGVGGAAGSTTATTSSSSSTGQGGGPTFECEPQSPGSPVLGGVLVFDPADPHPGDTVTVIVRSQTLKNDAAPDMTIEEVSAAGIRTWATNARAGGYALYYYALSDVALGDHCLVGKIDGAAEIGARFTVTPRPAPAPRCNGGVYKVVSNHQWTCDEEPDWGITLRAVVQDANGQGVSGAVVRLDWPATTERPIKNDTSPPEPSVIPPSMTTGGDGTVDLMTSIGDGDRFPTNENGYMVFNLSVDGCASDVATEITTGWWETNVEGCRYCPADSGPRNVWGHWSHTVTFRLDPNATSACVAPSDHAGQQACTPPHIHHDPEHVACFDVP